MLRYGRGVMRREWLIQLRKSQRLTQEQVAASAFIDRGYYSQIENGKRDPSPTVGYNISKALDFDPMLFFQYQLEHSDLKKASLNRKIIEFFRSMDTGEILYLYNDVENHFQNAVTFLLTGIENGSHCLVIDYYENLYQIQHSLETSLSKEEITNNIFFINKENILQYEPKDIVSYFRILQLEFEDKVSLRIWSPEKLDQENDWLSKLSMYLNTEDIKLNYKKTLFVRSYNALIVSAASHINMMRQYPYLMTDFEIVDSPLYHFSNRFILPSFFIQEKM